MSDLQKLKAKIGGQNELFKAIATPIAAIAAIIPAAAAIRRASLIVHI